MNKKRIWDGYHFKTYVVLEEAPKENRTRRAYVRCLACGDEKIAKRTKYQSKTACRLQVRPRCADILAIRTRHRMPSKNADL